MALHGEIKVNHETIGWWSAVRGKPHGEHSFRYHCEVERINPHDTCDFDVVHDHRHGAVVLAAMVLSVAGEVLAES